MSDGKVVFDIVADDSQAVSQVEQAAAKIEQKAKSSGQKVEQAASDAAQEVKEAAQKSETSLDGVTDAAKSVDNALDKIDGDELSEVAQEAEKATDSVGGLIESAAGSGSILSSLAGSLLNPVTAIGGAFVAAGGYAVNAANDMQGAMNQFQAATGVANDELDDYRATMESIYANNYGESFEDVATAMGKVKQQLGDISQEDLQTLTEGLYTLEDVFEADFNETLRGADQLMTQFGLTAEEALDLLAAGSQAGLDYTQELGDNIAEYAGKFAQAGYSAEEYFQLLANGSEGGAYNLDKVNDAINEVTTRLADGTIAEDIDRFSEATRETFQAWKDGEATQKEVIDSIVADIQECTNEQEAMLLASIAFGTMGEDANLQFVESLTTVGDTFDDVTGKMAELQEVKYDDLNAQIDTLKRNIELLVVPIGEMLIPIISTLLEAAQPLVTMLGETLTPSLEQVFSALSVLEEPLNSLLTFASTILEGLLKLTSEALEPLLEVFGKLLEPISELTNKLLGPLTELSTNFLQKVESLGLALEPLVEQFIFFLDPLNNLIDVILPPLQNLFEGISHILEKLLEKLEPIFDMAGVMAERINNILAPALQFLAILFGTTLLNAVETAFTILDTFTDILGGVIDFITGVFTGDWEQAWNGIVEIFRGIFNLIPAIVEGVINAAISVINGIINGINALTGVIGVQAIPTISSVTLPRFHVGGIVDFPGGEGLAVLRDGEMVLNQAQQAEVWTNLNAPGTIDGDSGASYNFELTGDVTMDGFKVGKVVLRNLDDVSSFTLRG